MQLDKIVEGEEKDDIHCCRELKIIYL